VDSLHGVGFCPFMEVGRGSVCDLEEDRLGRGTQASACGQGKWGETHPFASHVIGSPSHHSNNSRNLLSGMSVRNALFGKAHSRPVAMGPLWQASLVRSRTDPLASWRRLRDSDTCSAHHPWVVWSVFTDTSAVIIPIMIFFGSKPPPPKKKPLIFEVWLNRPRFSPWVLLEEKR